MKSFWRFWLCFSLLAGLLLGGCARATPPDRLGTEDFRAELRGEFADGGTEFVAVIEVRAAEGGRTVRLSYLAPEALADCELELLWQDGAPVGEVELRQNGISAQLDANALRGLLRPVRALLEEGRQKSLVKEAEGWRIEYESGRVTTFASDGTPIDAQAPEITLRVVCFEPLGAQ